MRTIALTSANEAAMAQVAEQLLAAVTRQGIELSIAPGVVDAAQAQIVYSHGGELWRIGHDEGHPELDLLVDRWIRDETPGHLAHDADLALQHFLARQPGGSGIHPFDRKQAQSAARGETP